MSLSIFEYFIILVSTFCVSVLCSCSGAIKKVRTKIVFLLLKERELNLNFSYHKKTKKKKKLHSLTKQPCTVRFNTTQEETFLLFWINFNLTQSWSYFYLCLWSSFNRSGRSSWMSFPDLSYYRFKSQSLYMSALVHKSNFKLSNRSSISN